LIKLENNKIKNKYMLCIDNGLSVGKAALIDASGSIAGVSSFKNEILNDGCHSEIDMELFYKKTANAIKDLIKNTGINASQIISVANSGHGAGLYPVDSAGNPVRNAITSMDSRGERLIAKWAKEGIDNSPKTYTNMWNGQAIPLLCWLKENEIKNYNRIDKILFCKDWIKFKLTGNYSTDYTDASTAGVINLNTKNYDRELYKLYCIEEIFEKLPGLNKSEEIIGHVTAAAAAETGLNEGTPVTGGIVDFIACLLGSGLYDGSAYSIVSGTWSINSAVKNKLSASPEITGTLLFPDNENFLVMDTSPTSAVNLEWFLSDILENLGLKPDRKQVYKKIDEEIEKLDVNESNIFYYPFIYRSKLSKKMEGAIIGFNASHNVYNIIYSIYEGVVFAHLMHINNLKAGGINCDRAVISGGATNSSLWCQVFSDILNMEVITTSTKEVGVLGLAIAQAVGMGIYKDLKEAIDNMVSIKAVYKPDSAKNSIYMKRFKEFVRIMQLLDK
jgi:L-xylulokinase